MRWPLRLPNLRKRGLAVVDCARHPERLACRGYPTTFETTSLIPSRFLLAAVGKVDPKQLRDIFFPSTNASAFLARVLSFELSRSSSAILRSRSSETFVLGPRFLGANPASPNFCRARRHWTRCEEYNPLRGRIAPVSPGPLQRPISTGIFRLYSAVNVLCFRPGGHLDLQGR